MLGGNELWLVSNTLNISNLLLSVCLARPRMELIESGEPACDLLLRRIRLKRGDWKCDFVCFKVVVQRVEMCIAPLPLE